MSGAGLPYRLRPAKFVDRELFADLIGQITVQEGRSGWVYVSMAGEHLADIQAVYRRSGIRKFYVFDENQRVVDRQRFNRHLPSIRLDTHQATALSDRLDEIVETAGADRAIIWLDFTGTGRRKDQIDDFVKVLEKLAPGDICRITLDGGNYFYKDLRDNWAPEEMKDAPLHEKIAFGFREALAPYSDPTRNNLDKSAIADELVACVGRACPLASDRPNARVRFVPLLLTRYGDGSEMVTVTVRCEREDNPLPIPSGWEWTPNDWTDILMLKSSVLSPKERAAIDESLDNLDQACSALPFVDEDAIRAYARFHRYQPNFQNVAE